MNESEKFDAWWEKEGREFFAEKMQPPNRLNAKQLVIQQRETAKRIEEIRQSFEHDKEFYAEHAKKRIYDKATRLKLEAKAQVAEEIATTLFWLFADEFPFNKAQYLGWEGHRVNTIPPKQRKLIKEFAGFKRPKGKLKPDDERLAFHRASLGWWKP